jgi:hypothetical protein
MERTFSLSKEERVRPKVLYRERERNGGGAVRKEGELDTGLQGKPGDMEWLRNGMKVSENAREKHIFTELSFHS